MTVIDRISFNFRMTDEQFARGLYADWDGFCHRCVTNVMEKFFSSHDTKDFYMEIDSLDLDLGAIPQENFMVEFPVRLREALERNFIPRVQETQSARTCPAAFERFPSSFAVTLKKWFDNLLHYLEHGFCLPEWSSYDFDPGKELELFMDRNYTRRIADLLVSRPYVFDRLPMHIGGSDFGLNILYAAILSDDIGEYEKRRYTAAILEYSPQTVIRFIHEIGESGSLDIMAGLIENPQVRSIMEAETENHAEIGLPEYWYRLYVWLIEYYPFNGVPMFGDKQHFRLYMNRSLLLFIHGRTYPSYLSKAELTVQFLMAVFGAGHYLAVLDIIYHNQQLNPDGSPAGADSYVWELYYMLLQLSLIKTDTYQTKFSDDDGLNEVTDTETGLSFMADREDIGQWLENTSFSEAAKKHLINRMVSEKCGSVLRWIKRGAAKRHLLILASFLDEQSFLQLAGKVSLQLAEMLLHMFSSADNIVANVSWLGDIDRDCFLQMVKRVVLGGIADGSFLATDTVWEQFVRIAECLYSETIGTADRRANGVSVMPVGTSHIGTAGSHMSGLESCENGMVLEPVRELFNVVKESVPGLSVTDYIPEQLECQLRADKGMAESGPFASLKVLLLDRSIPEGEKRWFVLQWFDAYHGNELGLLSLLYSERILEETIEILGDSLLRQVAVRLSGSVYGNCGLADCICLIVSVISENMDLLAAVVSRPAKELWQSLLVSLASQENALMPVTVEKGMEIMLRLLADTVGNGNVDVALECLFYRLATFPYPPASDNSVSAGEYGLISAGAENDSCLYLVSRLRKFVRSQRQGNIGLDKVQTIFEQFAENIPEVVEWLYNDTFPALQKRESFRRFMSARPDKALKLVQESIIAGECSVASWLEMLDIRILLELAGRIDGKCSAVLERTVAILQHTAAGDFLFKGLGGKGRDMAVAKALMQMLATKSDAGTMDSETVVRMFMDTLHYTVTGSWEYTDTEHKEWEPAAVKIVSDLLSDVHIPEMVPTELFAVKKESLSSAFLEIGQGQTAFDKLLIWFMDPSVSDTEKSQLLRHYARWQPERLWKLIMCSSGKTAGNLSSEAVAVASVFPTKLWASWLDREALLEMVSGISLTLGETLRQTITVLAEKHNMSDDLLTEAVIAFVAAHPCDRVHYTKVQAVVRDYVSALEPYVLPGSRKDTEQGRVGEAGDIQICGTTPDGGSALDEQRIETAQMPEMMQHNKDRIFTLETLIQVVEEELHLTDTEQALEEAVQPDYIEIPNAGLCLLAIWFTRLFDMLGLLEEREDGKKDLRDMEARIRAIFILQRIVTDEPRKYKEQELAFNRILTGCPFYVPLPKTLVLTNKEIQTVESMLSGVKSNWDKLKNTSVKGFQHSFIERPGKLEQRENKWVLYVENRSYDLLLDSLPWSYRQIRLPWLKKNIHVVWRDKEEFEFDDLLN